MKNIGLVKFQMKLNAPFSMIPFIHTHIYVYINIYNITVITLFEIQILLLETKLISVFVYHNIYRLFRILMKSSIYYGNNSSNKIVTKH